MYIHEAIKQAMPLGKCIHRRCDDWVQNRLVLYSTTTCEGMILCGHDSLLPRWEPNANDLLADDWEVLPVPQQVTPNAIAGGGDRVAERQIKTSVFLEGNETFVRGMDEITAALRRAAAAAQELNDALSTCPIRLETNQTSSNSAPQ